MERVTPGHGHETSRVLRRPGCCGDFSKATPEDAMMPSAMYEDPDGSILAREEQQGESPFAMHPTSAASPESHRRCCPVRDLRCLPGMTLSTLARHDPQHAGEAAPGCAAAASADHRSISQPLELILPMAVHCMAATQVSGRLQTPCRAHRCADEEDTVLQARSMGPRQAADVWLRCSCERVHP